MKLLNFLAGVVVVVAAIPILTVLICRSGYIPVATSAPPLPFEHRLAVWARKARLRKEMPATVPLQPTEENLVAGAGIYRDNCAVCHGLPNQPMTSIAKGMFPEAPQLFAPKQMVTDDPVGESYWKAANGIRLSGMPGFRASLSEQELWQVSLLLTDANKLPATAQQALAPPLPK